MYTTNEEMFYQKYRKDGFDHIASRNMAFKEAEERQKMKERQESTQAIPNNYTETI